LSDKIKIGDEETTLTAKQKMFCELYVSKEFFANGVQSYIEAYNVDTSIKGAYQSAKAAASENLTKLNLLDYINQLLELSGLNDEFVDKQTTFLITQNADFNTKLGAIREYNKLRQRIISKSEETINHKFSGFDFLPDNGDTETK